MKKAKFLGLLTAVVSLAATFSIGGCSLEGEKEKLNNIETGGVVYIADTQEISVSGTRSAMGDEAAIFLSDVKTSDITLSGVLAEKTVQSVSFVSSEEIIVVLSGNITATFDGAYTTGTLTVSSRALQGNADSYCLVNVHKPAITTGSTISGGSPENKTFMATFVLPYGAFTENATAENIVLVETTNGELTEISVSDDKMRLSVTIENYNPKLDGARDYPQVHMTADTTTFGVGITISVGGVLSSCLLV